MTAKLAFCITVCLLFSGKACAIKEDTVPADRAVIEKVWGDAQALSLKRGHETEVARRTEAEKIAETLRLIPPERVQEWIDGKLSREELEKVVALAQNTPAKIATTSPNPRVKSFMLLSVTTLILAFLYGAQRRRAQKEAIQKVKDQNLRGSLNTDGVRRVWDINN